MKEPYLKGKSSDFHLHPHKKNVIVKLKNEKNPSNDITHIVLMFLKVL
jgi:hypothetical protein